MHFHLEIIMPPTDNIEKAVQQILSPFDENQEDARHAFWDFYVIGGRFAGRKLDFMIDPEKKKAFFQELTDRKITVSGITCGKQELQPASQIPMVAALWNEYFPDAPVRVCPFFRHFNDQYKNSAGFPDICTLEQMPAGLTASRVIIAGPHWDDETGGFEAKRMLSDDIWNGVTHVDTAWDGKVQTVIDQHRDYLKHAKPEYAAKHVPQADWLVVTVDYHS